MGTPRRLQKEYLSLYRGSMMGTWRKNSYTENSGNRALPFTMAP
jgi:hypothetical protein